MKAFLEKNDHINALTGIRALAAGVVVFHHLIPVQGPGLLTSILEEFNVGVTIFFVLSGFLITYRYYGKYEKGKNWYYNYAVNRVARIYPMYFLLTSFTFLIGVVASHPLNLAYTVEYILNITLLRGFFSEYVYTGISQGWTLTVEECFYFSAPLLFLLSRKFAVLGQALFIFCSGYIIYLIFRHTNFHGFMNTLPHIYITTYFGRVFEFAIGIVMALWVLNNKKMKYATLIGSAGFLIIFSLQVFINYSTGKYSLQSLPGFFLNTLVLPVSIAVLIFGLVMENSLLRKFLQTKLMVLLGKSSYTLYLLHWGTTGYLIHRFISSNFVVEILVTYILSVILWYFIEEPCNRFIRKFKKEPAVTPGFVLKA